MTIYLAHITTPDRRHPGVLVFFVAEATTDRTAVANALTKVAALAHVLDSYCDTIVMGPHQASDETVQRLGVAHAIRGEFDPMLVSDTDYQDAYLGQRIELVGFAGLSDDEKALLEVMF